MSNQAWQAIVVFGAWFGAPFAIFYFVNENYRSRLRDLASRLSATYDPEGRLVPGSVSGRTDGRQFKIDFGGGKYPHTEIVLSRRNITPILTLGSWGRLSNRQFSDRVIDVVENTRSERAFLTRAGRLLTAGNLSINDNSVDWTGPGFITKADDLERMIVILSVILSAVITDLERPRATENSFQSLYEVIGVSPSASSGTITQACLRLGEENRPDKSFGSKSAARTFAQVERAYKTLTDPRKRAAYDKGYPPPFDEPWAVLWLRISRVFAGITIVVTSLLFIELFFALTHVDSLVVLILVYAAIASLLAASLMRPRFDGDYKWHVVLQVMSAPINFGALYVLIQHGVPIEVAIVPGVIWAAWLLSVKFLSDGYVIETPVQPTAS